ncbi:hypothetical protein ACUNWD_05275 [Sunxiuqinia sp. A32]|uniref:hypothetical protein n=1 Tax=Sunxiuqinia sp. A32 TaxID=3461496 RepID=UPI00404535CE
MKYLLLLGIMLVVGMCSDSEEFTLEDKTIYFQYEYVNNAWGYQHNGFIVDQDGNIYEYDQPENWNFAENNKISKADFEANLSKAELSSSSLTETELENMQELALKASTGNLTELKSVMADAGADVYAVYIADTNDNYLTYKLLQMRGDNYQKNTTNAADEITDWLIGIRGEPGFSDEHF